MQRNLNGVLAKMLASFVRDAAPDEIEEAVEAIDEITSPEKMETPPEVPEKVEDEGPDKLDMILEKLDALIAANGTDCKDEEPEEEVDPLAKLEGDLDALEKGNEEDEEPMEPEEDPDEPEAHFVDPEEINTEEDEEPEEVEEVVEEEEEKPIIAKLPPSERKKAADVAVEEIRKSSGLDAQPKKNNYVALKKSKKSSFDSAIREQEIGKRIMESRNPNYKK